MVVGNFLLPLRGAKLGDKYKHLITEDDLENYDNTKAFMVKDPVRRAKLEQSMFDVQYNCYTSSFYRENVRLFECGDLLHKKYEQERLYMR